MRLLLIINFLLQGTSFYLYLSQCFSLVGTSLFKPKSPFGCKALQVQIFIGINLCGLKRFTSKKEGRVKRSKEGLSRLQGLQRLRRFFTHGKEYTFSLPYLHCILYMRMHYLKAYAQKARTHKSFYPKGESESKNHERFNCIL